MIKTQFDTNMSALLNIQDTELIEQPQEISVDDEVRDNDGQKLDGDFELARSNLANLLVIGQESLNYALSVAKQSDDPKAYDAVAKIIKELAAINEQTLNLHLMHQKHKSQGSIKGQQPAATPAQNITNNTVFLGSTAELSRLIKQNIGEIKDVSSTE